MNVPFWISQVEPSYRWHKNWPKFAQPFCERKNFRMLGTNETLGGWNFLKWLRPWEWMQSSDTFIESAFFNVKTDSAIANGYIDSRPCHSVNEIFAFFWSEISSCGTLCTRFLAEFLMCIKNDTMKSHNSIFKFFLMLRMAPFLNRPIAASIPQLTLLSPGGVCASELLPRLQHQNRRHHCAALRCPAAFIQENIFSCINATCCSSIRSIMRRFISYHSSYADCADHCNVSHRNFFHGLSSLGIALACAAQILNMGQWSPMPFFSLVVLSLLIEPRGNLGCVILRYLIDDM